MQLKLELNDQNSQENMAPMHTQVHVKTSIGHLQITTTIHH